MCLGELQTKDFDYFEKFDIEATISSLVILNKVIKSNKKIGIHLALNTGMNRLGFNNQKEFKEALRLIKNQNNIKLKGVYSHIGDAQNLERTLRQNNRLQSFYGLLPCGMHPLLHTANSDTMQLLNSMHYDMVRVGINLYGYGSRSLKPVMSVVAKIVHTFTLKQDDYIGYGSKTLLKRGTKIAVLSIGYGQGFLRANSKFGYVILNGKLCKIVGNICMDMTMIDCTNANAHIGEFAYILGSSGMHKIDAEDLALNTQTISYEVLTNFGKIKNSVIL